MSNIVYDLDSSTGLMKLKFKSNVLDPLDKQNKEEFNKFVLPILAMNNKFVLTGSFSLKLLGFEPMDSVGDFDFGLMDTFTEDEYNTLINFFNLKHRTSSHYFNDEDNKSENKFNPKARMYPLSKYWTDENEIPQQSKSLINNLFLPYNFKLDIFNDEILRPRDIITIYYDDYELKLVHPSITWSYRMRYALDSRSATVIKYWNRAKEFMDSKNKHYFTLLNQIQKMVMRVHEHNTHVEGNKERIEYIRELVRQREHNLNSFIEGLYKAEEKKI